MLFLGAAALILGAMGIIFAFSGDKAMLKVLIGREKRALAGALGILGVIVRSGSTIRCVLLFHFPEPALEHASGLRDGASDLAAITGSSPHLL
jgi:hypothetical protein